MLGIVSFIVSIVSVIMSFFHNLLLPSFAIAIVGIIIAIISTYDKDVSEKEKAEKGSRAFEMGSIIVSAATILSYFVFSILSKI